VDTGAGSVIAEAESELTLPRATLFQDIRPGKAECKKRQDFTRCSRFGRGHQREVLCQEQIE
jgi:hypothetical protein